MSVLDGIWANYKTGSILDITGCGFKLFVQSLYTFPLGFEINEFADDTDPFDLPDVTIGHYQNDLNNELVFWNKPSPFVVDLNLVCGTSGEQNCRTLFNSNYKAAGKSSGSDLITMIATYANGDKKVALGGHINVGSPLQSISTNGRIKTQHYQFVFARLLN